MVCKIQKRLIFALAALLLALPLSAQKKEQTDSLVRLVKANSIELQEHMGRNYRKTVKATFLHNGTYLICDTALWNVEGKIINCWGNVQLIQDETVLTSEKLDYLVDEDLAQFRGRTVQLRNKKNNILRTRNLDYNTKDSVAVFRGGASMRDEDGQIIESREGTYESSRKLFTFRDNVNMFTDSVFVRTSNLIYDGERKTADFISYVDFWKDGNMLSAGKGWYRKDAELFFFEQDVHGLSEDQEIWCDSLYFYRNSQDVLMIGRAHVQDTSRHVAGMADRIMYTDSLAMVTMKGQAAVALRTEQENNANKIDTLYMGADSIQYRTRKMCDILEAEKKDAEARLSAMSEDPVQAFRRKAAEAAAKKAEEAAKKDPNAVAKAAAEARKKGLNAAADAPGGPRRDQQPVPPQEQDDQQDDPQQPDTAPEAPKDSLGTSTDSLGTPKDSIIVPLDTTKVGFMVAVRNVKIFRTDMQVRCDSLRYCDLDSIARFYVKPIIWNDGNRQYTSDSLSVLIRDGGVDRASLMSNAFIITQEDSLYFDQIKGAEVMAYFDTTSALRRFDALGGATATFFLKENESIATVNKVDSKMLSAIMKDGELERVYYFDAPKNDAYPIVQLPTTDLRMKGFNWDPDNRPKGKEYITSLRVKPTERDYYEGRPKAEFKQTEVYFPGHMKTVYEALEAARQRKREAQRRRQEARNAPADTLVTSDSLSFKADSLGSAPGDTLQLGAGTPDKTPDAALQPEQSAKPQAPEVEPAAQVKPQETPVTSQAAKDTTGKAPAVLPPADSLHPADSLQPSDSLRPVLPDSTVTKAEPIDSVALLKRLEKERKQKERWAKQAENERIRKEKQERRELARKLAIARRDAKWAELDSLDAAKQKLKDDRKDDRRRSRIRRVVCDQMVQDAKDEAKLQKYIERYTRRKERKEARRRIIIKSDKKNEQQEQPEPSGKRSPEAAAGGELPAPPSRRPEAS